MRIQEMFDRRDKLMIEWCEPWKGLGADGKERFANVILRVSVDGCIALQREAWKMLKPLRLDQAKQLVLKNLL